ncbi:MAG: hypothetical protein M3N54_00880, partial [Acidobacteriota bacterium]|nr:hypothetical protein [Acidobacteriota bacterium]
MPFHSQVQKVTYPRLYRIGLISTCSLLFVTGCNRTPEPATTENFATDPANGNLAQAAAQPAQPPAPTYTEPQHSQQYPVSPPPPTQAEYSREGSQEPNYSYNTEYAAYDQQTIEAPQPPPPLPEYGQPECPGDNYIWTPGYWSYAPAGYYWVPGAWVVAPYVNALWTPPYWESYGGRYRWHRGYWGEHIGFYGGINYGFGYTGRGYAGGFWRDGRFNYNRNVNNVNVTRVHNVYNYNIVNYTSVNRISYNGGRGGVEVRPTPPELAVRQEQRSAPVAAQVQHMRQAAENRAQFANVNQGRPQIVVATAPLATPYRTPAQRPVQQAAAPQPQQTQPPFSRPEMRSGADNRPVQQERPARIERAQN